MDRLVDALERLVSEGPGWRYAPVDGRWTPAPDPRALDPLGNGTATAPAAGGCGY